MDWIIPQEQFDEHLLAMEQSFMDPISLCHEAINYCGELSETYREKIISLGFPNDASEIRFFKREKPRVLGQLQFYQKRLEMALSHSIVELDRNKEILGSEMARCQSFLSNHRTMVQYLRLEQTAMDHLFFLRKHRKQIMATHYGQFHFDPRFSTSHDGLVAQIRAHQYYQKFLGRLLERSAHEGMPLGIPQLQWTDSKVDLMEIIFSISLKGSINKGVLSLKELVQYFQIWFNIDLGDPYHLAMRLRNRSHPTKFLEQLETLIHEHIETLES